MSASSRFVRPQRRQRWLTLFVLIAAGILSYAVLSDEEQPSTEPLVSSAARRAGPATEPAVLTQPVLETASKPTNETEVETSQRDAALTATVTCRQRATGAALAGVQVYWRSESIGSASDADGQLDLADAPDGHLTLWADGWVAMSVQTTELPDEVLFDPANGSLQVRIENGSANDRVVRSLVQPRVVAQSKEGPWTVELEERAPDRWRAEGVAPGRYDVYFWISHAGAGPRSFSLPAVEVLPGETAELSIDLSVAPDPNAADTDS